MTQTGGSGGPEPAAGGAPDSSVAVSTGPESEQAAAPEAADLAATASPDLIANSLGEYARIWWRRVRAGESGALPVVIGLIVIVVYFQVRNSLFLSSGNLVNLITQAAFIVTFGMAEVFVLLLGEIDLSVGYNAALGAVIALWMLSSNLPLWLAVVTGLAFSAAFAGLEGVIITRLRLPSFVVTLPGTGRVRPAARDHRWPPPVPRDDPDNTVPLATRAAHEPAASWIVMIAAVALTGGTW
jgi:D-xylose transport system permease protein